jgi:uroporphyrinogen-III decarboxylase
MTTDRSWADLMPDEKREERFRKWLAPKNVEFESVEAEEGYRRRVTRFIKAIKLEEADRVPVMLGASFLPAFYAGANLKTVMYDYGEMKRAWLTFQQDVKGDTCASPVFVLPAKVLEILDHRLHVWPGKGLADDTPSYQFVEDEYVQPSEYEALINNPSDFIFRKFLPRIVRGLAGFARLNPVTPFVALPMGYVLQYTDPEVRASLRTLLDAADEAERWAAAVDEVSHAGMAAGYPMLFGGLAGAPFDLIGDVLRGTKGVMIDMYRRPGLLLDAMERLTPIVVEEALKGADAAMSPVVLMPLHKGPAGFMSGKQFETFYWPTFKKVMLALIDDGFVPMPFAEGNYGPRLEIIKDMPRGTVIWYFETMDMARAKTILGNNACIAGNVPIGLLHTGTRQEVKEACRKLIETCAPGGGYILASSAAMDEGNPDNLRAMMEAAEEYGVYRSVVPAAAKWMPPTDTM